MNVSESTLDLLTPRQKEAIRGLRSMPVPRAPILKPDALKDPPLGYRFATPGAFLAVAVLTALILRPFLKGSESWQGPFPMKSGSAIALMAGKSIAFQFSRGEGTLILQGPAQLHLRSLTRHRVTGRVEADLLLNHGELWLRASSDTPKWIRIQTPLFTVRVTGTQLLVGHRAGQGSRLLVAEGTVQVKSADGPWQEVSPGVEWSVTPDGQIRREPREPEEWKIEEILFPSPIPDAPLQAPQAVPSSKKRQPLWHEEGSR